MAVSITIIFMCNPLKPPCCPSEKLNRSRRSSKHANRNHQSNKCQRRHIAKIKIPPQSLSFPFFLRARASSGSRLRCSSFGRRSSITLETLGKERDCSQSTFWLVGTFSSLVKNIVWPRPRPSRLLCLQNSPFLQVSRFEVVPLIVEAKIVIFSAEWGD